MLGIAILSLHLLFLMINKSSINIPNFYLIYFCVTTLRETLLRLEYIQTPVKNTTKATAPIITHVWVFVQTENDDESSDVIFLILSFLFLTVVSVSVSDFPLNTSAIRWDNEELTSMLHVSLTNV